MLTQIYWIPLDQDAGAVGVMPRPRGGDWLEDEIAALAGAGVTTLVSLLEPAEEDDLKLERERSTAEALGLDYLSLPMPDRGTPLDSRATLRVVELLAIAIGMAVVSWCIVGKGSAVRLSWPALF
jgi:hypothetical protein